MTDCKETVYYQGESIEVTYPAMILNYYAQANLEVADDGIWVEYCDHDGETKLMYNVLTEERTFL
jgi:hypothetical protein